MYAVCISEFPILFNHKNASYPETSPVSDYRREGTTKRFQGESVTLWENVPKANLHFNITKNIYM
jgi:hypothetical protein